MSLHQPASRRHALAALAAATAGTVVTPSSYRRHTVVARGRHARHAEVAQPLADFSALLTQTDVRSFAPMIASELRANA